MRWKWIQWNVDIYTFYPHMANLFSGDLQEKFNCQASKFFFLPLTVKNADHKKSFKEFQISLLQDTTRQHNWHISENSSKFYYWKAKTTPKTQQLILINTEVNIYLNSWTKFPLINR